MISLSIPFIYSASVRPDPDGGPMPCVVIGQFEADIAVMDDLPLVVAIKADRRSKPDAQPDIVEVAYRSRDGVLLRQFPGKPVIGLDGFVQTVTATTAQFTLDAWASAAATRSVRDVLSRNGGHRIADATREKDLDRKLIVEDDRDEMEAAARDEWSHAAFTKGVLFTRSHGPAVLLTTERSNRPWLETQAGLRNTVKAVHTILPEIGWAENAGLKAPFFPLARPADLAVAGEAALRNIQHKETRHYYEPYRHTIIQTPDERFTCKLGSVPLPDYDGAYGRLQAVCQRFLSLNKHLVGHLDTDGVRLWAAIRKALELQASAPEVARLATALTAATSLAHARRSGPDVRRRHDILIENVRGCAAAAAPRMG